MRLSTLFQVHDRAQEQQLAHVLRTVPLFRDVPADDLAAIWRRLVEVHAPAGTVLCRRGEPGDRFFIIQRGAAEVRLGLGAAGLAVRRLGPGDFFGEMALLTGQPRSADIVVAEEAVLWVLDRTNFDAVSARSVPLLRALLRTMCERVSVTTRALEQREAVDVADAGLRFGPYRVLEQIRAGGSASVYAAVHDVTEAAAAVKVLPAAWGAAPELRERLSREARILQRIAHPAVIRVLEVGEVEPRIGGGCYLAMEWLPNALDRTLRAQYPEPFAPATALGIGQRLAEALAAVHAAGLVHRDVKPSNVLLRSDGTPVLTDFGLATAMAELAQRHRLTPPNMIVGTADYVSPEQACGEPLDGRSDVYSLGVVLYELLAGKVPYAGRTPLETLQAHIHEPLPPLPASVPAAARAAVERALQKRPADRFDSAAAMARALALALVGAPAANVGAERRTAPRLPRGGFGATAEIAQADWLLGLEWWNDEAWQALDFAVCDVSQSGLGLLCSEPPGVGARLRAMLRCAGEAKEVTGRIVYDAPVRLGAGLPAYRCGVAFDDPQPVVMTALVQNAEPAPFTNPKVP